MAIGKQGYIKDPHNLLPKKVGFCKQQHHLVNRNVRRASKQALKTEEYDKIKNINHKRYDDFESW